MNVYTAAAHIERIRLVYQTQMP